MIYFTINFTIYFLIIYLPSAMFVMMSWVSFFIPPVIFLAPGKLTQFPKQRLRKHSIVHLLVTFCLIRCEVTQSVNRALGGCGGSLVQFRITKSCQLELHLWWPNYVLMAARLLLFLNLLHFIIFLLILS